VSLTFKKNKIAIVLLYMYIHIIEIPTNKGANSYELKISKIGSYLSCVPVVLKRQTHYNGKGRLPVCMKVY